MIPKNHKFERKKMIKFLILLLSGPILGNFLVENSILNIVLSKDVNEERMSSEDNQPELILYYRLNCPFCQTVLNYLKETSLQVSLKNVSLDPIAKEELYHIGGKIQVPCLFIDGTPLYESQFIIDWLKEHQDMRNKL